MFAGKEQKKRVFQRLAGILLAAVLVAGTCVPALRVRAEEAAPEAETAVLESTETQTPETLVTGTETMTAGAGDAEELAAEEMEENSESTPEEEDDAVTRTAADDIASGENDGADDTGLDDSNDDAVLAGEALFQELLATATFEELDSRMETMSEAEYALFFQFTEEQMLALEQHRDALLSEEYSFSDLSYTESTDRTCFAIRLDGIKPYEPYYQYPTSAYSAKIWYYNGGILREKTEIFNNDSAVAGNLLQTPSQAQINAALAGTGITYNEATQEIVWYVIKFDGSDGWHVDGIIKDKDQYLVTYYPNGGVENGDYVPAAKAYTAGTTVQVEYAGISGVPYRDGWKFLGWAYSPDAVTPDFPVGGSGSFSMPARNVNLYAVWEQEPPATACVTICKQVDGNLGDRNKEFSFTAVLKDEAGNLMDFPAPGEDDAYTVEGTIGYFRLKHGGSLKIDGIPVGAELTVSETNAERYQVSVGEQTLKEKGTAGDAAYTMTVEENRTITFQNRNEAIVDTGIMTDSAPYVFLLCIVAAGMAAWLAGRRRWK